MYSSIWLAVSITCAAASRDSEERVPPGSRGPEAASEFIRSQKQRLKQIGKHNARMFDAYDMKRSGIVNCIMGSDDCMRWGMEQKGVGIAVPVDERYAPSFEEVHRTLYPFEDFTGKGNIVSNFPNPHNVKPQLAAMGMTPKFFRAEILEKGLLKHRNYAKFDNSGATNVSSSRQRKSADNLFILEVGTAEGMSSKMIAAVLSQMRRSGRLNVKDAVLLCIDPWHRPVTWGTVMTQKAYYTSGGSDSIKVAKDEASETVDPTSFGRSLGFDVFMESIRYAVKDRFIDANIILPFHATNDEAMNFISLLTRWRPDIVFLDSSHSDGETWREIHTFFSLLPIGGLLVGDDYRWGGVTAAADRFVSLYHGTYLDFWVVGEDWAPDQSQRFFMRKLRHLHLMQDAFG